MGSYTYIQQQVGGGKRWYSERDVLIEEQMHARKEDKRMLHASHGPPISMDTNTFSWDHYTGGMGKCRPIARTFPWIYRRICGFPLISWRDKPFYHLYATT